MRKITYLCSFAFLLLNCFGVVSAQQSGKSLFSENPLPSADSANIVMTIISLRNNYTKLSPSHIGHPGYEHVVFLYDAAVNALTLKAAGFQKEAEQILDYFTLRLRIPLEEVVKRADSNGVYGILKLLSNPNDSGKQARALVNALDITNRRRQGKGALEFWSTPGPTSFMIFAMLQVNAKKYIQEARLLGETLLAMQGQDGGVCDGDRAPEKVHTEPHMDAYDAFLMLYKITGEEKWLRASEKAFSWFRDFVYHAQTGVVDQGRWLGSPSTIFATDVYSWTMAGPAGDKLSPQELKKMTEQMLRRSLTKVTLSLPENGEVTVILCDFSDATQPEVKKVRYGFHPMGSVEWTGGVILALEKNAVRFEQAKDHSAARFYKALAKILFEQTMQCFYRFDESQDKIAFYATGQGVEVGPFGSIEERLASGWKTPFFYVKDGAKTVIKGGSTVAAWPLFTYFGINPFILDDNYARLYEQIPLQQADLEKARDFLNQHASSRTYQELVPGAVPIQDSEIVEPELFNRQMWYVLELAYAAKERGDELGAKVYFEQVLSWAKKTVENPTWIKLAQRDNLLKEKECGGIVAYPWGNVYPENDNSLHFCILHYPLLNEVAAAMWGMAEANLELGNEAEAKYWVRRIIEEVPLHQIPDVVRDGSTDTNNLIRGYWNAIISWEESSGQERDGGLAGLYRQVLAEKGLSSAKPSLVIPQEK